MPTFVNQTDVIVTTGYPVTVQSSVVAAFSGVQESFTCEFYTVSYTADHPLGIRHLIGQIGVAPPTAPGKVSTVFIAGVLTFDATEPGTADIRVYGNGVFLGSRPVAIIEAPK